MSVEFEPVKVGPRRRRIDPALVGAVIVVLALLTAVVKPWEATEGRAAPPPTSSAVAVAADGSPGPASPSAGSNEPTGTLRPSRPPEPSRRQTQPPVASRLSPSVAPTIQDVGELLSRHDVWGMRAIVIASRTTGASVVATYAEQWAAARADRNGVETVFLDPNERTIAALGVTVPEDVHPLDVRIWRLHTNDGLEWIDTRPIDQTERSGQLVFIRLPAPGTEGAINEWEAGTYRVDVLHWTGIHRMTVAIQGRFDVVPAPGEWPRPTDELIAASASDPSTVRFGPFATVDGVGIPLASRSGSALTELEAWRDSVESRLGPEGGRVAAINLPRATGVGVMLIPHAEIEWVTIRRLAPGGRIDGDWIGGISERQGGTPYIVFAPPDGGAWTPGVYAIGANWKDGDTLHVDTWHVELRPGRGGIEVVEP